MNLDTLEWVRETLPVSPFSPKQHRLEKAEAGYSSCRGKERVVNECSAPPAVPDAVKKNASLSGSIQIIKSRVP